LCKKQNHLSAGIFRYVSLIFNFQLIMYNPFSLENKTILVTGASSGIGKATAIECSKMGAKVVITGRNAERLQQTFGQLDQTKQNDYVAGDLTSEEFITELVGSVLSVDGVVLCAGIPDRTPMKFATPKRFLNVLNINLLSQTNLIRELLKTRKINKNASMVFISSVGAYKVAPGLSLYSAAKSALISIMKGVAVELSARKIRANAILPSMVKTPLINMDSSISTEDWEKDEARYPLGYGEPEDVAFASIYLLSDASKWMTGSEIVIDGGFALV
jgi:NAD(P)-dependent dehydrogenase (short-subunit alcohol dehydrogenase family)